MERNACISIRSFLVTVWTGHMITNTNFNKQRHSYRSSIILSRPFFRILFNGIVQSAFVRMDAVWPQSILTRFAKIPANPRENDYYSRFHVDRPCHDGLVCLVLSLMNPSQNRLEKAPEKMRKVEKDRGSWLLLTRIGGFRFVVHHFDFQTIPIEKHLL